jgi:saccharopine dehydrogenase-like NADP-dependent oxidoreductase
MKRILVLGAGRSSSSQIQYLVEHAPTSQWHVTVGDVSVDIARQRIGTGSPAEAVQFDMNDGESGRSIIGAADIIVSLLPPKFHPLVAVRCLEAGKHLLTASYVSDEMKTLDADARGRGLLFLNECGLDPGIDHLSAMQVIDRIRQGGGAITSFESFTGGLIAPETDPGNPWRYKFTWNPRNVVLAGQGTAKYLYQGKDKFISYPQLFQRLTPIEVPGYGPYEGYANRDSLKYITTYGLTGIQTMLRGTLRNKGFCKAWNIFVQLGCCDDILPMENVGHLTHAGFIDCFLPPSSGQVTVREKLCTWFGLSAGSPEVSMLQWSGFFDETPVGLQSGTPAKILEYILNKKWKLERGDKDQIVMWHRFMYEEEGRQKEIRASLVATGTDEKYTAMAKTVGWPLAIATKLLAFDKIKSRGVVIPTTPEFYEPILDELATLGIALMETQER